MKKRLNCWEFMGCGREVGGARVAELGVCPSSIANEMDGINRGSNAGRFCWTVAGSLCGGEVQGTFVDKILGCLKCRFFKEVEREEGSRFIPIKKSAGNPF